MADVFEQATKAIRGIDLNGNGVPDWAEPGALEFAWHSLLFFTRRLDPQCKTLFCQGVELAEQYRQHVRSGGAAEVSP
jgi:hypothetical protein